MPSRALAERHGLELVRIARTAVEEWAYFMSLPIGVPHVAALVAPGGAVVSVRSNGRLSARTADLDSADPLYLTVQKQAVAAATAGHHPLRVDHLTDLSFEVCVVDDVAPIADAGEVSGGRLGVYVAGAKGWAVLLPDEVDAAWTGAEVLARACKRAGLASDAWRAPDVRRVRFSAQVFREDRSDSAS